jgi:hypothetical protein
MLELLSEAGRSFLRAFFGSLLILLPGVLAAPNLDATVGLGVAALIASLAAGLKAIQVFIPQLSFASVLPASVKQYYAIVDSAVRAFIAAFVVSVLGWLAMPDLSVSKSLVVAALVAAVTAAVRAVQGALTPGDVPAPATGLTVQDPEVARLERQSVNV